MKISLNKNTTKSIIAKTVLTLAYFMVLQLSQLSAQIQGLQEAVALSHQQKYEEAEIRFKSAESDLSNIDYAFNIARGYNFSWWGKYEDAKIHFNKILAIEPNDLDAIIGLAYTKTWAGEYAAAVHTYNRALALDNSNKSAYFGLTHNYLSANNIEGARFVCNQILKLFPNDAEANYLDGLVSIKELDPTGARRAFKRAVATQPDHLAATEQLGKLVKNQGKWEIEGWYGINKNNNGLEQGLRRAHAQYQFNNRDLAYVLFDNSLILDNSFLGRTERVAPLIAVGAKHGWNDKLFSKLEVGRRFFETTADQTLINLETNYFLSANLVGKLILQYDNRQSEHLGLVGLGLDLGLTKFFFLETSFYYNENFTFDQTFNQRYQLAAKALLSNFELLVGGYFDQLNNNDVRLHQFGGFFAIATFPIHQNIKGKLFFNHDKGFFNNKNTVGAIGINLNI